jgi:hypothetical protein
MESPQRFSPAEVCRTLLAALDAAEGRRKRRKRDQTPDSIGLGLKREILEQVVLENPAPEMFEEWLLRYAEANESKHGLGAVSAMARAVLEEWRLAHAMNDFKAWLDRGAPSEDADATQRSSGGGRGEKLTD